jgi:hypothetical protein
MAGTVVKTPYPRRLTTAWFGLFFGLQARLEASHPLSEIAHGGWQLAGAEKKGEDGQNDQPVHYAEAAHEAFPCSENFQWWGRAPPPAKDIGLAGGGMHRPEKAKLSD